ncbi:pilus assembly protein TadG-related protein [Streptomyces sp. NPDC015131]|uniref:pilus assembly protein TadG-related protein n=1 Tax=Streptomyces sp. NPDC015131 TaxID=3364941 RepID=UPI0036FF9B8C
MTRAPHTTRETGQASPIYIFVVASLLFLALAFFAVGQAGATRNGAQSAADAAALAAAKESRDRFELSLATIGDLLDGELGTMPDGCDAAADFAARNKAALGGCVQLMDGRWGFRADVVSQEPVGDTVLPGTEGEYAHATATAIVVPLCDFLPLEGEEPAESDDPAESEDPAEGEGEPAPGSLDCDGDVVELDPADLPDMSDLFEVRLAED